MIRYIVFDSGSSASKLMFADLKKMNNVYETSYIYKINNPILRYINRIHMSLKVSKYISLPLKQIWNKYNYLEQIYNKIDTFILVFTNISIKKVYMPYLLSLKKRKNVKVILVAVDSFVDIELSALPFIKKFDFDLVYSFDRNDCKKYGLEYTESLYSMKLGILPSEKTTDLFFVGRAKDRLSILTNIVKDATNKDIKVDFSILDVNPNKRESIPGITYINKVIPYDKVLPQILASKCLLDIVQEGQSGMTMRIYEAIFYNKKLITNNNNVKNLKYYNPQFIQVIESVYNIDYTFIKNNIKVDYNYTGDYSPINFLHIIEQRLREKKSI